MTLSEPARIFLKPLDFGDAPFMLRLLNTPGWIECIGDRQIHDLEGAEGYVQRILNSPGINYWIITLQTTRESIGIVTFIHREALPAPDLGFALMPEYARNGYAFEAASLLLHELESAGHHTPICAITITSNLSSIALLKRLGFTSSGPIRLDDEEVELYELDSPRER